MEDKEISREYCKYIVFAITSVPITTTFQTFVEIFSALGGDTQTPLPLPWDTPSQTLPPLGRFAPSQITFRDMEIYVISTGARSLIIMMNVSSCPLAIWRKSYSSHLCPKYASETVFFGLQMQSFPALGGGHPHLVASLPRRLLSETWKYRSFPEALAR